MPEKKYIIHTFTAAEVRENLGGLPSVVEAMSATLGLDLPAPVTAFLHAVEHGDERVLPFALSFESADGTVYRLEVTR